MYDFRDWFADYAIPAMAIAFLIISPIILIFSFADMTPEYTKVKLVHIGQTISTGGISGVLQTEIRLSNGWRGFTYTDWIDGIDVGDELLIDKNMNIKKVEK